MRTYLTAFVIAFAFMNVAASVRGQSVTIKVKNAELHSVFNEIKKQTGYLFWYEDHILKGTKKISLDLKNATLTAALDASLAEQPLVYTINDKTIVIKLKEKTFFERMKDAFKAIDVQGKILDENGQPLKGANIKVRGSNMQTTSDNNGTFYLPNVADNAMLEISYIGYITKEVKVQANISITLLPATENLQEIQINAGYYTVSNRERTGSISRVDSKTIGQQPISNPLAALIGRMPGVNIEQLSGLNGGGYKIEIRGRNSLRNSSTDNGNNPLYIINGVPYPAATLTDLTFSVVGISGLASPLNSINPNDIESVEILKDADATAIYGSRGANGVVLITTKKAKTGQSNYQVNVQQGFSEISTKLDLLNSEQYFSMRQEAFTNDGVSPGPTHYDMNGTWPKERYTDWQKELISGTAKSTAINASISGGSEFTQYSLSGNYNRQTTVFPIDFADVKGSGLLNLTHLSQNKKFNASFSTSFSYNENKLPKNDFTQYIFLPPNAPLLFEEMGNLNWGLNSSGASTWTNPISTYKQPYLSKTGNFISSGTLGYEVIPGLSLKSNFGYTMISLKERMQQPISSFAPILGTTGSNRIRNSSIETWSIEPQINYKTELGKATIDVLLGSTLQSTNQTSEALLGSGYTSDLLIGNIASAPTRNGSNSSSQYKYAALFGRLNYNLNGTYILNLTARRDGSSRFGPTKQFANFGAIGAAWVFSKNQKIAAAIPFLSFGKIRGSFGVTGSDQIPDYGYLETYASTNPYADGSGLFPSQLANPDYSWETNKKLEAAIDLGFANDRILLAASWYRNRSSNQLVGYKLPDITGFTSIQYNLPATVQNTGWEFELQTANVKGRNFNWSTSMNLTIPDNKLISYPGIEGSSYANTYTVGASLFQKRNYRFLGVNPDNGIYRFEDVNGNNALDAGDRQASRKAFASHWYGGINNNFIFKNFSLDVFVQLVSKTVTNPFVNGISSLPGSMNNQLTDVLDRWQRPGDAATFAKFTQNFVAGGAGASFEQLTFSDHYMDGSFARLKNVSISYTLPSSFITKAKIQSARIYVQGQNLFTITKYPGDPEVSNLRTMPTLRTVSVGFSLGL